MMRTFLIGYIRLNFKHKERFDQRLDKEFSNHHQANNSKLFTSQNSTVETTSSLHQRNITRDDTNAETPQMQTPHKMINLTLEVSGDENGAYVPFMLDIARNYVHWDVYFGYPLLLYAIGILLLLCSAVLPMLDIYLKNQQSNAPTQQRVQFRLPYIARAA